MVETEFNGRPGIAARARDACDPLPEARNEVPSVAVCTPYHSDCTVGYAQSFFGASRDRTLLKVYTGIQCGSSLLPTSFNECLAGCLNLRDTGKITHMAMLHADIAAEVGWLDLLWSEMWINSADFISAIVPIKSMNGRTSTAIGKRNDRWTAHRCIFMSDLARLPETFGPERVCGDGEILLVNTGCWLTDLRHPFWDWFATVDKDGMSGFNVRSRITQKTNERGIFEWAVDTRSEDWDLSYDMAAFGVRYLVTQKVKLWHEGGGRFPNHIEGEPVGHDLHA